MEISLDKVKKYLDTSLILESVTFNITDGEKVSLFELKEGYNIEEKLNRVCKGLNFGDEFLNQEFNLLSGGEKTTVTLGKLLIDMPDVLLLDEPTNHLDMESVEWLEEYLKSYKGIVIVVSHDRYFLDNVVTKIIEIEGKESDTYVGNYSSYLIQKDEKLRIQLEDYLEQNKKIKSMEQTVKQLRDWAARADNTKFYKRAASMQLKLDKMERVDKPTDKQNMKLNLKQADRSGRITISAKELSKSFGQKTLFCNTEMEIYYGERVALIGSNGSGKTTFLKMLLEEEMPDAGKVQLGASVLPAYLPQNITFKNDELTALEYFREDISILEGDARAYLAKFLFYGNNVFKRIKLLSGGERLRLMLARLLYNDINLLILDEPTNHLDTRSIESIEEALESFRGTILFISHDRYFINKISNRVIAIEDEGLQSYLGNYDYYKSIKDRERQQKEESKQRAEEPGRLNKKPDNTSQSGKSKKPINDKHGSGRKPAGNPVKAARLEKRIADIEKELQEIEGMMDAMASDYEELSKLYERKVILSKEFEEAMEEWLGME